MAFRTCLTSAAEQHLTVDRPTPLQIRGRNTVTERKRGQLALPNGMDGWQSRDGVFISMGLRWCNLIGIRSRWLMRLLECSVH